MCPGLEPGFLWWVGQRLVAVQTLPSLHLWRRSCVLCRLGRPGCQFCEGQHRCSIGKLSSSQPVLWRMPGCRALLPGARTAWLRGYSELQGLGSPGFTLSCTAGARSLAAGWGVSTALLVLLWWLFCTRLFRCSQEGLQSIFHLFPSILLLCIFGAGRWGVR